MRQAGPLIALTVLLVAIMAAVPNAHASDVSMFARWPSYPNVQFYVDASCSPLVNGPRGNFVDQSLQLWTHSFNFHYTFTNDETRGANKMFLFCTSGQGAGDPPWAIGMAAACEKEFHGGCTSWAYLDGQFINGLPLFNYTYAWILIGPYIDIALPHEIGHMLGLTHSTRMQDLMYAGTQCFDFCRELTPSQDDFSVLNAVYSQPIPEFSSSVILAAVLTSLVVGFSVFIKRKNHHE